MDVRLDELLILRLTIVDILCLLACVESKVPCAVPVVEHCHICSIFWKLESHVPKFQGAFLLRRLRKRLKMLSFALVTCCILDFCAYNVAFCKIMQVYWLLVSPCNTGDAWERWREGNGQESEICRWKEKIMFCILIPRKSDYWFFFLLCCSVILCHRAS